MASTTNGGSAIAGAILLGLAMLFVLPNLGSGTKTNTSTSNSGTSSKSSTNSTSGSSSTVSSSKSSSSSASSTTSSSSTTTSSSSLSSKSAVEDNKRSVAHMICRKYIEQYFYPYGVKIHSILGVGRDYAYGESWVYGVDVTVTSTYGGSIEYMTNCIVAQWENIEKGYLDGATGKVISFKAERY